MRAIKVNVNRVDDYIDGLIARNPEAFMGLVDLVDRYQKGEVSDEEHEAGLKASRERAARRR